MSASIHTKEVLPEGVEYTNVFGLDGLYECSEITDRGDDQPVRFRIYAIGKDGVPVNHFVRMSRRDLMDENVMAKTKSAIEREFERLLS